MFTIAVPLDGSTLAESILPHAIALAARLSATLLLVRVVRDDAGAPGESGSVGQEDPLAYVHHVRHVITSPLYPVHCPPSDVQTIVVDVSENCPIEESMPLLEADLVVMATHGRTGFRRAIEGSITARILDRRNRPIIVLYPDQSDSRQSLAETLQHPSHLAAHNGPILLPLDSTLDAETILQPALMLAQTLNLPIHLLHVIPPAGHSLSNQPAKSGNVSRTEAEMQQRFLIAEQYLCQLQRYIAGHNIPCQWSLMAGDPLEQITQTAVIQNAAFVAMATHAHGQLKDYLAGSLTHAVLRQSHRPMLIQRCAGPSDMIHMGISVAHV